MKEWRERLDQQLSLLVEEGTLTVEYKNAVLVQGFLERFIETVVQEEREKVVEEVAREIINKVEVWYWGARTGDILGYLKKKYLSKKGEMK